MSLEVSNYSIKAIVAEYVNMKLNVLARTQEFLDQDNLSAESCKETIIKVKKQITSLIGYKIKNIILVMPSGQCRKYSDKYRVDAKSLDQVITKDEITEGLEGLVKKNDSEDWLVTNVTIDKYSAYGYGYVSNPVGLETRYIELEGSVYVVPTTIAYPLIAIVEEAGFNIVDVCIDILALTTEAVPPSILQQGVVMIDLNHDSTNIAYFKDHTMKAYSMVEIGAKHITNDLALCAQINFDKAEAFKKKYVSLDDKDNSNLIVYRYYDEYTNKQVEITQTFLSDVAKSRMDELVNLINIELDDLKLTDDELIYICGGGNRGLR
jgi:cell division protein FtsA